MNNVNVVQNEKNDCLMTVLEIEGTGVTLNIDQEPVTHAMCEYCNKPVLFVLCRKVNDLPCCIDCMANLADDLVMRADTEIKEDLYYNLFDAGFEQSADMVFSGLTEDQQQKANIRYNRK